MSLLIKPIGFKRAKHAVINWHYSKAMPSGKLIKYGVFENNKYIGVIIYGRGANQYVPQSLGLKTTECCELVRVALKEHTAPVTQMIAITLRILKKTNPGLKVVFSYADETNQNHQGIIYKAGNWEYHGKRKSIGGHYLKDGKLTHNRTLNAKYGSTKNYPSEYKKAPEQVKHFFTYKLRS